MFVLVQLLALAAVAGSPGESIMITRSAEQSAEQACSLVRANDAGEAKLESVVYQPLAIKTLSQMQQIFGKSDPGHTPAAPSNQTTYRSGDNPLGGQSLSDVVNGIKAPNDEMITNAAASVADVIVANYRDAYQQQNHDADAPTADTFHDHEIQGKRDRTMISQDIRTYCGKLSEMGITELFPQKQDSSRPDSPSAR